MSYPIAPVTHKRDPYYDILKAIAIILVVGCHTYHIKTFDLTAVNISQIIVRSICNAAVPIFLAISGYLVVQSVERYYTANGFDYIKYIKAKTLRVYYPCLIYSAGWFILDLPNMNSYVYYLKQIITFFLCGYSVYYFVIVIMQCYILTPTLIKHPKTSLVVTCAISMITIMITSYIINVQRIRLPLIAYAGPAYLWIIFFMLGIFFRKFGYSKSCITGGGLALIGLGLQIGEAYYIYCLNGSCRVGIKPSSFIFSIGVIMLLFSTSVRSLLLNLLNNRYIQWLGTVSFTVYLIHMYPLLIINHYIDTDSWFIEWALGISVTVGIVYILDFLIKPNKLRQLLGL